MLLHIDMFMFPLKNLACKGLSYSPETFNADNPIHIRISGLILGLRPVNETALLCNDVSHWLGTNIESALYIHSSHIIHPTCDSLSSSQARSGGIRWAIFSNAPA